MTKINFQKIIKKPQKTDVLAVLVLFLFSIVFQFHKPGVVKADEISELNEQINQVREQLLNTQQQRSTLQSEVAAFDSQIYLITLQINQTQAQLDRTQREIDETLAKIKQAEDDLLKQKETLGENIKVFYEEGQVSSIEVIASSDNFSEYMDRSEYLRSLQDKIVETVDKINILKKELEAKKKELETKKTEIITLKNQQLLQKGAINSQRNAKDALLRETKGLESNYQSKIKNLVARRAEIIRQNNETVGGGSTAYPYGNPPIGAAACNWDYSACKPDAYSYFIGQCTSYAAWWRSAHGNPVPRGLGNGGMWGVNAKSMGFTVDISPKAGDVVVMPYVGDVGHVAIVDSVNGDGTINISEFNWGLDAKFQTRTVNIYNYAGIQFIH